MTDYDANTMQKLLRAFSQFRKSGWHDRQIAGYNPSEIKVLMAIRHETNEEKPDMKVSEISSILRVTSPTVTQIINKLEKDDLVERNTDPVDRRAVNIHLTEKGIEVTNEARKAFTETFAGLIDHLGEDDSEKLAELLNKVFNYFEHTYRQ